MFLNPNRFARALQEKLSPATIDAYNRDITLFGGWMKEEHPGNGWGEVTPGLIYEYLEQRGTGSKDRNRSLSALRSWFKYLKSISQVETNPADEVEFRYEPYEPTERLSLNDVKRLADIASRGRGLVPARNHRLILFVYGTGLRTSELLNLRQKDIWEFKDRDKITQVGDRVSVSKNMQTRRIVYLSPIAVKCLESWMSQAQKKHVLRPEDPEQHVWVTVRGQNKGKPMSPAALTDMMRRTGQKAELTFTPTLRMVRFTFKRELLEAGVPEYEVRALLGLADNFTPPHEHEFWKGPDLKKGISRLPHPYRQFSS